MAPFLYLVPFLQSPFLLAPFFQVPFVQAPFIQGPFLSMTVISCVYHTLCFFCQRYVMCSFYYIQYFKSGVCFVECLLCQALLCISHVMSSICYVQCLVFIFVGYVQCLFVQVLLQYLQQRNNYFVVYSVCLFRVCHVQ